MKTITECTIDYEITSFDLYKDDICKALLIRKVEEKLLHLFGEGKLFGTVHTCIGQELAAVAIARSTNTDDYWFSNHRCHGHYLARTLDAEGLIGEIMGKENGICKGIGGSQHLYHDGFFSNGIQGGIVPVSAGLAFTKKYKRESGIGLVSIGDGTLGQGVLYETLNLISKWQVPLLVILENNSYSQSTSQATTLSGSIDERFSAFGIKTFSGNTWHFQELFDVAEDAINFVRDSGSPAFLRIDTYRLKAHSKGDDNRNEDEVNSYHKIDPINKILSKESDISWLKNAILEINEIVDKAVELSESTAFHEFACSENSSNPNSSWVNISTSPQKQVDAINKALSSFLLNDKNALIIGEDIESPYGGAFKITKGLSNDFPKQVKNFPISEAAMLGIANGMALGGLKPIVEVMFGDFLTLCMDQWLNHAAKFSGMYAEKVEVPLILRTPMGGNRGYGPTHSQSIEKHFLGVPGTRVICLHHRCDVQQIYDDIKNEEILPTLIVENKTAYGRLSNSKSPDGFLALIENNKPFPMSRLKPNDNADITIISIGGMSIPCEEASLKLFDDEEIIADLFFPTQLYPFDINPILKSVEESRALLVVEEGQSFVSLSGEILAQLSEKTSYSQLKVARLCAKSEIIPTSRPLEAQCLPNVQDIILKAKELLS